MSLELCKHVLIDGDVAASMRRIDFLGLRVVSLPAVFFSCNGKCLESYVFLNELCFL